MDLQRCSLYSDQITEYVHTQVSNKLNNIEMNLQNIACLKDFLTGQWISMVFFHYFDQ